MKAGWLGVVAVLSSTLLFQQSVFERVRLSSDVSWLEQVASDAPFAVSLTPRSSSPKDLQSQAYIRLGAIGTKNALEAIRRVENKARNWRTVLAPLTPLIVHPIAHVSDWREVEPFISITVPDGTTYGLISLALRGGTDVFLVNKTETSGPWSRPYLLPHRPTLGIQRPQLQWAGDRRLILTFDSMTARQRPFAVLPPFQTTLPATSQPQTWTIVLDEVTRDTDADGLTDTEEDRLQLRRDKPDSDDDGVADGEDASPGYPASPLESTDTEAAILRKAFFATFGVHGSQSVLIVDGRSRPLQLWGSRGPVLFGIDALAWHGRALGTPPRLSWRLEGITNTGSIETATVKMSDYEGPLSAAGYTVTLTRLDGEWFVTKLMMDWIS